MKRSDLKYLVNTLLFISLAGMVFIGLLMGFVLGEGPAAGGRSKFFLGLHRHQWGEIHFILSLAFTALVVVHLALGWRWMKSGARTAFGKKAGLVLAGTAVAAVAAPFVFWLFMTKNDPAFEIYGKGAGRDADQRILMGTRGPGTPVWTDAPAVFEAEEEQARPEVRAREPEPEPAHGRLEEGGLLITGQMTLRDVSRSSGIPVSDILHELGLPQSIPSDETVGRIRRLYGISVVDIREAVSTLIKNREKNQQS